MFRKKVWKEYKFQLDPEDSVLKYFRRVSVYNEQLFIFARLNV